MISGSNIAKDLYHFFTLEYAVMIPIPQTFAGPSVGCQEEWWVTLALWDMRY